MLPPHGNMPIHRGEEFALSEDDLSRFGQPLSMLMLMCVSSALDSGRRRLNMIHVGAVHGLALFLWDVVRDALMAM